MKQWICLMLTLSLLVCVIPLGVMAADEVVIAAPVAGSFLEAGSPVVITVNAAKEPALTANGTKLTAPVSNGNGGWDFAWTPQEAGVVTLCATVDTYTDEKNIFVGATSQIEIQKAVETGETVITPKGMDEGADVLVLAFDVTFTSVGETVAIKDATGTEIVSYVATAAETAAMVAIFDKEVKTCSLYQNGKLMASASIQAANLSALRISAASVTNITMRQSAEPGISIVSPAPGTKVMVGEPLTVTVKTNGLSAGQTIKVVAKDGTTVTAAPVDGKTDEYVGTFAAVTDKFHSISAIIEGSKMETEPVSLALLTDALLKSWNFNEGTLNTEGSLDAKEELFWNSKFTYQNGKPGEGLAAYNTAPSAGGWQGTGLGVNFKTLPYTGRTTIEYDMYIDGKIIIRFMNSSGTYKDAFSFNGAGGIWNSMASADISSAYTSATWQKHKLVFDHENEYVKLYIDTKLVIDQKWEGLGTQGTLKSVSFSVLRQDSGGKETYIDNLAVYTTQEIKEGAGGEVITGSLDLKLPSQDAFLEKGKPVIIKAAATRVDTVAFYAGGSLLGNVPVSGGSATYAWTPEEAGTTQLKVVAGSLSDTASVEVVATEQFYFEALNGPDITETDNINTWGGLQNFDEYRSGGKDGGNYGVMKGAAVEKYVILNCPEPKNPGMFMVEMDVKFPAGSPASIGLANRSDSLGSNEMFYIGATGCGYHDAVTGTWTALDALPTDQWVNVKYIENMDEALRAIYINGEEVYQGPVKHNHLTFGGLSFAMNKSWVSGKEFYVDNIRICTAPSQLFARSATMLDNNTIRINFSKAVSIYKLDEAVKVYRGDTEIPVSWQKNGKYLDLTMTGDGVGSIATEYTVVVSDLLTAEDGMPLKRAETFNVRSAGQSANIDAITWESGAKTLTTLSGLKKNDTVAFSLKVKGQANAARLILAIYSKNENGTLVLKQSAVAKGTLNQGVATPVSAEFTLNNDIVAGDYIKAFILDAETAVPLADPIMIKAN